MSKNDNYLVPEVVTMIIKEVIDAKKHPEQRQHFIPRLVAIRDACDLAISIYEKDKNSKR